MNPVRAQVVHQVNNETDSPGKRIGPIDIVVLATSTHRLKPVELRQPYFNLDPFKNPPESKFSLDFDLLLRYHKIIDCRKTKKKV